MSAGYYVSRRKKYDRDFMELRKAIRPLLAARKGIEFSDEIERMVIEEYGRLLPKIPYIGGNSNRLTWNLVTATMGLAFYRAMKARGVPLEEIGELTYRAMEAWYGMLPKFLLRLAGSLKTGRGAQGKIKRAAVLSRELTYPADWIYDFVKGGPADDFDFGVDYSECAIVKFFAAEGAAEFTPFLCLFDFAASECMGLGMTRTTTIAEGNSVCNFRFKRGRRTEKGWPPKFLKH